MVRILVGAVVGGIVVFMWGFVSHMLLPLGEMGLSVLPDEEPIVTAMKGTISEPGVYLFPGLDMSRELSDEETAAWEARYEAGPRGMLVYNPTGAAPLSPRQLGIEFVTNVLSALIAATLLATSAVSYGGRVLFVTLLGVFAWATVNVPHWNWYGFTTDFTLAEGIGSVVGWLLAGIVLAALVKGRAGAGAAPAVA